MKTFFLLAIALLFSSTAHAATLAWTDTNTIESGTRVFQKVGAGAYAEIGQVPTDITTFDIGAISTTEITCFQVQAFKDTFSSALSEEACTLRLNAPSGLHILP